ncbi:Ig-like domain-containing protein [Brevibacillus sp. H7]|uniref:Ig-like domain-containing protein n=1 Tax=Brevibacillus sp. H7 TaxID=3349138 RepID=UPI0037F6F79C
MKNKKLVLSVLSTAVVASMATSAFAAPGAGLYIGGNVDKYYSVNAFLADANFDNALDEILNVGLNKVLFVGADGKAANLEEIFMADKIEDVLENVTAADFETDGYAPVNTDGTTGTAIHPEQDPDLGAPGELAIESVSAIDATTVEVTFSQEVDEASAETLANYVLSKQVTPPQAPVNIVSATLDADKKKVTLVYPAGTFAPNTKFNLYVSNIRLAEDLDVILPQTTKEITIADVAPAVAGVSLVGTAGGSSTVDITFTQTVNAGTVAGYVAKTEGETDKVATSANVLADGKTVRVTFPALTAGKAYTIALPDDVQNGFGKLIAADATASLTAVADTVKPTIVSVSQDTEETDADDQVLNIKFSEKVNASTITVTVFAADFSSQAATIVAAVNGQDTVQVTVPDTFELKAGQTYTVRISASDATDASGNAIDLTTAVNKTFTAVDKVAPLVSSITKLDNKTVKVKFNENVTVDAATTFSVDGVASKGTVSGDTVTLTPTASTGVYGTEAVAVLNIDGKVKDAANNERTFAAATDLATSANSTDEAAPLYADAATAAVGGTTIALTFSENLDVIADVDTAEEVAQVLTITNANGTVVDATYLTSNNNQLEITVGTIAANDVYYIKFKSGQTVVADVEGNKFTGTKTIQVSAQ